MIRGLYTSATGMLGDSIRVDVISNNLGNANTAGYKRDQVVYSPFRDHLIQRLNDGSNSTGPGGSIGVLGTGSYVDRIASRHLQGNLTASGNERDVSIEGQGFFVVDTPAGQRYTRVLSLRGTDFRTTHGYQPAFTGPTPGPVATEDYTVDGLGRVIFNNQVVGQLRVVRFADPSSLEKQGSALWRETGASGEPQDVTDALIRPGYLESSNVQVVLEMAELVNVMRAYEANQKAVQAQDSTLDRLINDVGRVM